MYYGQPQSTPLPQPRQAPLQQQPPPSPAMVRQQLGEALSHAQDTLCEAKTVFPFTLFPDFVAVDRAQVTISHRAFWQVSEVISVRIEDILNVTANIGPFFGSIKIATRFFNEQAKPYEVHYLWRADALKLKRILQGYVIAARQQINCDALSTTQLSE
ncbi:MAG TPA: hypothetical protein VLF43_03795, partial [Candidatus Saccharimonadales bacterium]|nr:hypothetical protein [Candidatus Saccharimonadales bacterium]